MPCAGQIKTLKKGVDKNRKGDSSKMQRNQEKKTFMKRSLVTTNPQSQNTDKIPTTCTDGRRQTKQKAFVFRKRKFVKRHRCAARDGAHADFMRQGGRIKQNT